MMGSKARSFDPIDGLTLADLVPADHFYRHVACYAAGGRPAIDPIVFLKLQLVMFFEGIRSERQLLAVAADRLSVRRIMTSSMAGVPGSSSRRWSHPPKFRERWEETQRQDP